MAAASSMAGYNARVGDTANAASAASTSTTGAASSADPAVAAALLAEVIGTSGMVGGPSSQRPAVGRKVGGGAGLMGESMSMKGEGDGAI